MIKNSMQEKTSTRKLLYFELLIASVIIAIIVAGVIELNPVDNFTETPDRAIKLVNDSIELYDEVGTNAFTRLDVDPEFHGMELYVYVIRESDGVIVAHGEDKSLVGKSIEAITEIDGQNVANVIRDSSTEDGKWIEYVAKDPVNKEFLPESVWIKTHDGYIFASGIFHPEK